MESKNVVEKCWMKFNLLFDWITQLNYKIKKLFSSIDRALKYKEIMNPQPVHSIIISISFLSLIPRSRHYRLLILI